MLLLPLLAYATPRHIYATPALIAAVDAPYMLTFADDMMLPLMSLSLTFSTPLFFFFFFFFRRLPHAATQHIDAAMMPPLLLRHAYCLPAAAARDSAVLFSPFTLDDTPRYRRVMLMLPPAALMLSLMFASDIRPPCFTLLLTLTLLMMPDTPIFYVGCYATTRCCRADTMSFSLPPAPCSCYATADALSHYAPLRLRLLPCRYFAAA